MDDLRRFIETERETNELVSTIQIFSKTFRMEFGSRMCVMLILHPGKVLSFDEVDLPNREEFADIETSGYR